MPCGESSTRSPRATETTIEANPETVTPQLAALLHEHGVTRISVGAQSFQPRLLTVLERRAGPDDVRRAVHTLRDVGFDNISLDLLYGIPGQGAADLQRDLAEALALETEHLSATSWRRSPERGSPTPRAGARSTGRGDGGLLRARRRHAHRCGFSLVRDVELLSATADGRDLRAHHNLGIWHGHDYLGVGVGAVSTLAARRRRNGPRSARTAALAFRAKLRHTESRSWTTSRAPGAAHARAATRRPARARGRLTDVIDVARPRRLVSRVGSSSGVDGRTRRSASPGGVGFSGAGSPPSSSRSERSPAPGEAGAAVPGATIRRWS